MIVLAVNNTIKIIQSSLIHEAFYLLYQAADICEAEWQHKLVTAAHSLLFLIETQ